MKTKRQLLIPIIIVWAMILKGTSSFSQNGVGINSTGAPADPSSMLDISSTSKGFLPPRMTEAQRDAIASPVAGLIVWCTDCGASGELRVFNGTAWVMTVISAPAPSVTTPIIITSPVGAMTDANTICGGNAAYDGGSPVTVRGVCWSISSNPDVSLSTKTIDGSGTGIFTSSMTGLIAAVTYHVRAYATNSVGTSYGEDITFINLAIGMSYQGGKVAYLLLQPNEIQFVTYPPYTFTPLYQSGTPHGIIAAPTDAPSLLNWIDASNYCDNLSLSGYSDWGLPERSALNYLCVSKNLIGGIGTDFYWSNSVNFTATPYAYFEYLDGAPNAIGYQNVASIYQTGRVRAVRAF